MRVMRKQLLAMLLVFIMTISMLPVTVLAAEPAVVAAWNFTGSGGKANLPQTSVPTSIYPSSTFSHFRDSRVDYDSTNSSLYTPGWGSADGNDKYWQIQTSTAGCEDLTLTFSAWGFSRSPKKFTLQYSTNNHTYYNIGIYELTLNSKEFSFRLPDGAENADILYIRFLADKASDAKSITNESVISTSSSRIANVKITTATYEAYASVPEPSIVSGSTVSSGTKVSFSSGVDGGVVYYENSSKQWEPVPKSGLTISGDIGALIRFKVKTVKSGLSDSNIRGVMYFIKKNYIYSPGIDPIPDLSFPSSGGAVDVQQAKDAVDRASVKVVGQLVYRFGNSNSTTTSTLQDVINNELVSLQVYSDLAAFEIGDVVEISGIKSTSAGVPQVENISSVKLYMAKNNVGGIVNPAVFDNFTDLLNEKENFLSAVVQVKNVQIGAADANGTIILTDNNSTTMPIANAARYPDGIAPGETVTVLAVLSRNNSVYQLRTGAQAVNGGRVIYEAPQDQTPPVITIPGSLPPAQTNEAYPVSASVTDNRGLAAVNPVTLKYQINAATEKNVNMVYNSVSQKWEYTIPAAELTVAGEIRFTITAKDISNLTASSGQKTVKLESLPQLLNSSPNAGATTGADKTPDISATLSNVEATDAVKLNLTTITGKPAIINANMTSLANGVYTFNNYTGDLPDGKYRAVVSVLRPGETKATEFSWVFTIGEYGLMAYFGQLHSHTAEYSDGTGTLADGLQYIRNIASADNVDFVAFTDHSNYFDTSNAANPADALGDKSKMTDESRAKWEKYVGDMHAFNVGNNDVLAIPGFEMTWSGGPGHINTFNTDGLVSRNNSTLNNKSNDAGMKAYYEELKKNPNSISQFNHPGTTFGTFANFSYWDADIDNAINLIEVGNGEGAVGGSGYFPSYEYYIQALDKGWHLAPTNNQDNHKGKWGNSNTTRTVIITDTFTEEGLLQGMRNMSMYSTEDKNLEIMYTLNDLMMGSSISADQNKLNARIELSDPDGEAIGTVEVVANGGRVVWQQRVTDSAAVLEFELEKGYSYYFVRVIQPDRDIAVTAPVWVGETVRAGITEVTANTLMPVRGEDMTFAASVYNYETQGLVVERIDYSITRSGSNVPVGTATNPGTVAAGTQERLFSFNYTPDATGLATLNVKVTATLGGVRYTYESSYDFEVLDPTGVIPIAIDAGHNNFYVSGNYANSDTAFIEMCNRNGIRVTRLAKGELTYENIKNMKLLVLTVPYKAPEASVADSLYTTEELSAIRRYAQEGGNLLVTSKSDRSEPEAANEKASAITNEILEIVGAKARVEAAIIVDPARKSNEAYRITLGGDSADDRLCFNYGAMAADSLADMLLRDVEAATNNTFSVYNGAPIIANGATPIVSGFPDTTFGTKYSSLSENQVTANSPEITRPGATHVVVAETLSGGGFLVTSGVTFFSTFEVKPDLDYAGQLQNSNYQIVQNILDKLNPVNVSSIADIHAADEGQKFTVEGIVTSNASGFSRDTAFFDCIYIQDNTAGINVFPVDGNIQAGQTVRVTGYSSLYNGERQLNITGYTVKVTDSTAKALPSPVEVTSGDINIGTYLGSLVRLIGTIERIEPATGTPESVFVKDSGGEISRVFIDGYITPEKTIEKLEVGQPISAIGLVSHDTVGYRVRIRDRADIDCINLGSTETLRVDPSTGACIYNPITPVISDSVTLSINETTLNSIIEMTSGNDCKMIIIEPRTISSYKTSTLNVGLDGLRSILDRTGAHLVFRTSYGDLTLSSVLMKELSNTAGNILSLSFNQEDATTYEIAVKGDDYLLPMSRGLHVTVNDATGDLAIVNDGTADKTIAKSDVKSGKLAAVMNSSGTIKVITGTHVPFTDVPNDFWGYDGIDFFSMRGTFRGVTADTFDPDGTMTRGMVVTAFHRIEQEAAYSGDHSFADVTAGDYFAAAVAWAVDNELVMGVGDNRFDPAGDMTRAQIATIIYRYAKTYGLSTEATGSLANFIDSEDVPDWAEEAMSWAVGVGLINGYDTGEVRPNASATRAETSVLLYRFVSMILHGRVN